MGLAQIELRASTIGCPGAPNQQTRGCPLPDPVHDLRPIFRKLPVIHQPIPSNDAANPRTNCRLAEASNCAGRPSR